MAVLYLNDESLLADTVLYTSALFGEYEICLS